MSGTRTANTRRTRRCERMAVLLSLSRQPSKTITRKASITTRSAMCDGYGRGAKGSHVERDAPTTSSNEMELLAYREANAPVGAVCHVHRIGAAPNTRANAEGSSVRICSRCRRGAARSPVPSAQSTIRTGRTKAMVTISFVHMTPRSNTASIHDAPGRRGGTATLHAMARNSSATGSGVLKRSQPIAAAGDVMRKVAAAAAPITFNRNLRKNPYDAATAVSMITNRSEYHPTVADPKTFH